MGSQRRRLSDRGDSSMVVGDGARGNGFCGDAGEGWGLSIGAACLSTEGALHQGHILCECDTLGDSSKSFVRGSG